MSNDASIEAFAIDSDDVAWACDVLGLPRTAFGGEDGTDPRLSVILSTDTLDIEACPGSGKTTLLVAKLAILARKWTKARRGLCVLSHTNVARREIESRLGNTSAGQRLLSYPHFIGTIHGFVNEFLALPWLRSLGYHIEMIDDDVCLRRRWQMLSVSAQYALKSMNKTEQVLRFNDVGFKPGEIKGLGADTPTFRDMVAACQTSAHDGYFCHDEMFVFARDLLDKMPSAAEFLRNRFPLLFLDEVQDNNVSQSDLIDRIFMMPKGPVTRQRFGDSNQAIFQFAGQQVDAGQDVFPNLEITRQIKNSYRFDQSIADLADPLAIKPQGLRGLRQPSMQGTHTLFLFDDETIRFVLEGFARYLTEIFTADELRRGSFSAVAATHRPGGEDHLPRTVSHYWDAYDHEITRADPRPGTFIQYMNAGRRHAELGSGTHTLVESMAGGLLRLISLAKPDFALSPRIRRHLYVLELLKAHPQQRLQYLDFIRVFCIDRNVITRTTWESKWMLAIERIASSIIGMEINTKASREFLAWDGDAISFDEETTTNRSDNVFRWPMENPAVLIKVGSIHSVKGETHTATLVLDSFYRAHHLKTLKPWLTGTKAGGAGQSAAVKARLRLHYVAMSRPSRLLCLAMREDALTAKDLSRVIARGWKIGRLTDAGTGWG